MPANFSVSVNEKNELFLSPDLLADLDIAQTGERVFHALKDGKSATVTIESVDFHSKTVVLKLNGKQKIVKIQDEFDALVKKMGLSSMVVHKISAIKAPMPGLVLSILVEPGQAVAQGEPLLILEAMKMENIIKAPGEGVVKKLVVEKGKPVEKGEILIEME